MAVLACLVVAGCSGSGSGEDKRSGQEILDEANKTMSGLTSVTVEGTTTNAKGQGFTARLTTDLDDHCTSKTTWNWNGAALEQIRIGETDYVRPNRAYIEWWSDKPMDGDQDRWIKTPASKAEPGDGLARCPRDFSSFGTAKRGEPTEVDGTPAISVVVTDKRVKTGKYTFYVATEGKPYLLKVVYKGSDFHTTTTYSGFDKPLDLKPPTKVLDTTAWSH
ncbi:hypothetical protein [Streptomyces justiciae]|uniref:hypothetical protein n=1 Tax=Streptomyces justiciae TaxID=2780140 RepID=UPI002118BE5D|nr:hypothetical protein [Streptomyces justiciae]MCW8381637.1 hypothetical protein [Streptomyces justiciae]